MQVEGGAKVATRFDDDTARGGDVQAEFLEHRRVLALLAHADHHHAHAAHAQALLKEAGWADGFRIVLTATSDRYPNDSSVAQSVGQMWSKLGLKVEVETLPGAVFFSRASKQEFSAFAAQYGAEDGINSTRALVASFNRDKGYGTASRVRYSNPRVDALVDETLREMDDEARQEKAARAVNAAMSDQAVIPLFFPMHEFAAKKSLVITPRPQRRFNALMIRPAKWRRRRPAWVRSSSALAGNRLVQQRQHQRPRIDPRFDAGQRQERADQLAVQEHRPRRRRAQQSLAQAEVEAEVARP